MGLLLEVSDPRSVILWNGKDVRAHKAGGILQFRFGLSKDIEFHRLSVIQGVGRALVLDISVEHRYAVDLPQGGAKLEPKWSTATFRNELQKYRTLFRSDGHDRYTEDLKYHGLKLGSGSSMVGALPQLIGRLEQLLLYTPPERIAGDFHRSETGSLDRGAILSALKQNHELLFPTPDGSIRVGGVRYSTVVKTRRSKASAYPDLTNVLSIIEECAILLKRSSISAASFSMLRALCAETAHLYPPYPQHKDAEGELFRPMKTGFGAALQRELLLLVTSVRSLASRDPIDSGLLFLEPSIQDHSVFETSAYAACAKAFGFSDESINSGAVLRRPGVVVANTNTRDGQHELSEHISSWRQQSIQPSGYKPDTLIVLDGIPVIVDAKFRVPKTFSLALHPDGVKDVQAYMDDFGLAAAIMLAPRIYFQGLNFVSIEGAQRKILGIALQDSDDPATHETIATCAMEAATYST